MAGAVGVEPAIGGGKLQVVVALGVGEVEGVVLEAVVDNGADQHDGFAADLLEDGKEDGHQDGDDGDDDEEFDEGESKNAALGAGSHVRVLLAGWRQTTATNALGLYQNSPEQGRMNISLFPIHENAR